MLGYVQSKVLLTVTFSVLQLQQKRAQGSIRLHETNKTLSLDFLLGLRGRVHSEVKFDVRLRAIKSSAHRQLFPYTTLFRSSPTFDSSRQDQQDSMLGFCPRVNRLATH